MLFTAFCARIRNNCKIGSYIHKPPSYFSLSSSSFTEGDNADNCIIFIGNAGTLYGNVILQQDVTFAEGRVLTILGGKSLTIPVAVTLTHNGTIENQGTIIK